MKESNQKPGLDRPVTYQIKVRGHLDEHWSEWFDDLAVTYDEVWHATIRSSRVRS